MGRELVNVGDLEQRAGQRDYVVRLLPAQRDPSLLAADNKIHHITGRKVIHGVGRRTCRDAAEAWELSSRPGS